MFLQGSVLQFLSAVHYGLKVRSHMTVCDSVNINTVRNKVNIVTKTQTEKGLHPILLCLHLRHH